MEDSTIQSKQFYTKKCSDSQYFVWPPLFLITVLILLGILSMKFSSTPWIFFLPRLSLSLLPTLRHLIVAFPTLYFSCWSTNSRWDLNPDCFLATREVDVVAIQKIFCNFGTVARGAILHKYLTIVNLQVKF